MSTAAPETPPAPTFPTIVDAAPVSGVKVALVDFAERVGATFAQGFLAAITVRVAGVTELDALKIAAVAGGYAAAKYALVKANSFLRNSQ